MQPVLAMHKPRLLHHRELSVGAMINLKRLGRGRRGEDGRVHFCASEETWRSASCVFSNSGVL